MQTDQLNLEVSNILKAFQNYGANKFHFLITVQFVTFDKSL